MPTDPPGLSAHPISFTIQIPPPQPHPGPCEWAHSTTRTFPCSQEDFSPSLSAGKKPGQHLGITFPCQCPTAPCPHTQGGESTIHCIPSPSLPHPIPCKPDFPTHPTGQQVWLPHTMSVYCSGASGVAADGPCSSLGLGWAGHPRTASASQVLGAGMRPGEDSTKWKLSLGKAWQHLRSCLPLAEELLLVFISFLQRSMTRSLSKPSQPKDRSR